MTFICDNYLLYSGYLIFCFWKVTLSLFGTYRSIFDEVLVRKVFLGFTDNFHFVKFLFSDFLIFLLWLLFWAFLGPIRPFFGFGWRPKIFWWDSTFRLINFFLIFFILDVVCGSYWAFLGPIRIFLGLRWGYLELLFQEKIRTITKRLSGFWLISLWTSFTTKGSSIQQNSSSFQSICMGVGRIFSKGEGWPHTHVKMYFLFYTGIYLIFYI